MQTATPGHVTYMGDYEVNVSISHKQPVLTTPKQCRAIPDDLADIPMLQIRLVLAQTPNLELPSGTYEHSTNTRSNITTRITTNCNSGVPMQYIIVEGDARVLEELNTLFDYLKRGSASDIWQISRVVKRKITHLPKRVVESTAA